jgi:cell division protein FtsI (penicillin-binding protein 3)
MKKIIQLSFLFTVLLLTAQEKAAPVFKEIAQKIYTTTSVDDDLVKEKFSSQKIGDQYSSFYNKIKNTETIPNVIGMPAMDAVSLLENVGLNVKIKGIGKVKKQSIKKGTLIKKGSTIILNLS